MGSGRFPTIRLCSAIRFSALWLAIFAYASMPPEYAQAQTNKRYAAMVVDHNTGKVLLARNADARRHPASLVKMMTLYLLFEEIEAGRLSLNSRLKASARAARQPPSKVGLKPGQTIKVADAIRVLVTKSANDVAVIVAENVAGSEARFVQRMMARAKAMGMRRTVFRNAHGLPNAKQVTTARDMAILARRLLDDFPDYAGYFGTKHFKYRGKRYQNHNGLLFTYKGVDGIKTGYIRASGFNVAVSARRGRKHLIAIVMGGKTARVRNAHAAALLDRTFPDASTRKKKPPPAAVSAQPTPPRNPQRQQAASVLPWAKESAPQRNQGSAAGDPTEASPTGTAWGEQSLDKMQRVFGGESNN